MADRGSGVEFGPSRPVSEVLEALESLRADDVDWRSGRAFSLAYSAGDEVLALAEEAYRRFSGENALNTGAFPSLRVMQGDVVDVVRGWLHGDDKVSGFMTSGGTESLILAVRSAQKRAEREGRRVTTPNMVLPASAHAALEKAADYFGVESRRVPVGPEWRADVDAMAARIDDDTILVVGSAPQYPQGVVDPIAEIADLARARDINCHVDACMGGVTLPYLERSGLRIPAWDFRVPGVTSISVDLHKYGYSAKGAGVLLHRNKVLRNDQTFVTDRWLGGVYGSSGILGTKSGGSIAAAWAVMRHLGDDGYQRLADVSRAVTLRIVDHVQDRTPLRPVAAPDSTLVALWSEDVSVHAVAAVLASDGWYVDRQGPPESIHLTVNAVHEGVVDRFLSDLDRAVQQAGTTVQPHGQGPVAYGTVE